VIIIKLEDSCFSYGRFKLDVNNNIFDFDPMDLSIDKLEVGDFIKSIDFVINKLASITNMGYLNNHNLGSYPIISDLIKHFTNEKDEEYISGKLIHISFKWLFNLIYVTMYRKIVEYEKHHGFSYLLKTQVPEDRFYDLIDLRIRIYQKLDPSIRKSLQKKGITILQNVETGFDTEYVNKDLTSNKLLSVQLAQVVQSYIKIPLVIPYELSYINPSTEANYPVKKNSRFAYNLIEKIIDKQIVGTRKMLYGELDRRLNNLIKIMKQVPYLLYQIGTDYITYKLPLSPERTLFKLINENGYSLTNFLEDSTQLSKKDIIIGRNAIVDKLKYLLTEISRGNIEQALSNSVDYNRINLNLNPEELVNSLNKITVVKEGVGEVVEEVSELELLKTKIGLNTINYSINYSNIETISEKTNALKANITTETNTNPDNYINNTNTNNNNNTTKTNTNTNTNTKIDQEDEELKCLSRKYHHLFTGGRISFTYYLNNILIGHNTPADLSLLKDFESFKPELDLVNKSIITLGKGFRYGKYNVVIRDTMLLAPAPQKKLANIGKLYNFEKIELSEFEITNMDILLKTNPNKFQEYAMKDSLITLKHALWMEGFYFNINGLGVPTTLSHIGNKFVKEYWIRTGYPGYQMEVAPEYLIGEASIIQTPQGLSKIGDLGLKLSLYISNYKGGRNESFMYGVDINNGNSWYDYDLVSAYTTVLSKAGHPDYVNGVRIAKENLRIMKEDYLLNSYTIIKCNFVFSDNVKYPSIPMYVDETTTVYPLEGEGAVLTGAEYLLAKSQGCQFEIEEVYTIPFLQTDETDLETGSSVLYPFNDIIKDIQRKRREHPKGTISNLMYKEIGNSIYGSVVRGMSDKRKYDNKLGKPVRMHAHYLTNPIIAS